jgi:integrase
MRTVGDRADGHRLCALIVLLWHAGLRINEALTLQESDLDRSRGAVLVRRGQGGKRREVGMDRWAWDQLEPLDRDPPSAPDRCASVRVHGPTAGRRWEASAVRKQLDHAAAAADVRRRFAPHQLRRAPRSKWRMKASRSSLSNGNSGTPTSASPASISKASVAAK